MSLSLLSGSLLSSAGRAGLALTAPALCRGVGNRQRLYGEESGHGPKNEVRKVKAERKHKIRATGGMFR